MIKNYLKIAIRNIRSNKVYSIINILGLITGICSTMLIYLYVTGELNFDTFHKDYDRIYRISVKVNVKDQPSIDNSMFTAPVAPAIKQAIPEIESSTRISSARGGIVSADNRKFNIDGICFADSAFLDVFSFNLAEGNKHNVLSAPNTAVITSETAEKLFGKDNPVGKEIQYDNNTYEVTGIIQNPPANSHIQFNMLLSFNSLYGMNGLFMSWDGGCQYVTYAKLNSAGSKSAVNKKLQRVFWDNINKRYSSFGWKFTPYLQPLKDVHLKYDDEKGTRITRIYIFSAAAILILLIACINYINLTIAGSLKRSREIGLKKVMGASRIELIKQFVFESFIFIAVSLTASLLLYDIVTPYYKKFIGEYFNSAIEINFASIAVFSVGAVTVILLASFYPAFYLSRKKPVDAIYNLRMQRLSRFSLKNILIFFQFMTAAGMISATLIIYSQLNYVQNRNLGYNKDNMLIIHMSESSSQEKYAVLKDEILKLPGVKKVSASSGVPVNNVTSNGYLLEGSNSPEIINIVYADKDFVDTYGIKLVNGRKISDEYGADKEAYMVNSRFVEKYNIKNPLGFNVIRNNIKHEIVGVTGDFNYASAYQNIEPLIITTQPEGSQYDYLSVLINPENSAAIIKSVSGIYNNVCPGSSYEYTFLDDTINLLYTGENNFSKLFLFFAGLSVILSVTGLLGLTIFSVTQKRKEIGIRKVLGASVANLVGLSIKEYLVIIISAIVVSSLITRYLIDTWLEKFVYRINVPLWAFFIAGIVILMVAFITIAVYSAKAAAADPVKSLKYE